jgi:transcriptional regulator with XRE-family HTH domain
MAANVAALLDKAKLIHRIPSDYKLALVMGVRPTSLTNYRQGKTLPDARVIRLICDLTGDDAALLAAEIEAQRAPNEDARALWRQVVERLTATVHAAVFAVLFGVAGWGGFSTEAQAAPAPFLKLHPLYIVECVHRWCRAAARSVLQYARALFAGGNHVQGAASIAAA